MDTVVIQDLSHIAEPTLYDILLIWTQIAGTLAIIATLIWNIRSFKKQSQLQADSLKHSIDSFRLTTRPIAHFEYVGGEDGYPIICIALHRKHRDRFFSAVRVRNIGSSPLNLYCTVTLQFKQSDIETLNIREEFSQGKYTDYVLWRSWGTPMLPNSIETYITHADDLQASDPCTLVFIFFYHGIDGRLYDTLHIEAIDFEYKYGEPKYRDWVDSKQTNRRCLLTKCKSFETYSMYSEKDAAQIKAIIEAHSQPSGSIAYFHEFSLVSRVVKDEPN